MLQDSSTLGSYPIKEGGSIQRSIIIDTILQLPHRYKQANIEDNEPIPTREIILQHTGGKPEDVKTETKTTQPSYFRSIQDLFMNSFGMHQENQNNE